MSGNKIFFAELNIGHGHDDIKAQIPIVIVKVT